MQVTANCHSIPHTCIAAMPPPKSDAAVLVADPVDDPFVSKLEMSRVTEKRCQCFAHLPRPPLPSARRVGEGVAVVAGALGGAFLGALIGLWCGGMGGVLVQVMLGSDADIASPALMWGARIGAGLGSLVGGGMVVAQIKDSPVSYHY